MMGISFNGRSNKAKQAEAEAQAKVRRAKFDKLDTDEDGRISAKEYQNSIMGDMKVAARRKDMVAKAGGRESYQEIVMEDLHCELELLGETGAPAIDANIKKRLNIIKESDKNKDYHIDINEFDTFLINESKLLIDGDVK
jgi:tRNA A37 N6-isopentenylltransferase MiaA